MDPGRSDNVTKLLAAWTGGDAHALHDLMPLVYSELHRIARHHWQSQPKGHMLQPTALLHEAYLRLAHTATTSIDNRKHFFALASLAMRQILVNHAESRLAGKRGGGQQEVSLSDVETAVRQEAKETLDLHVALKRLEAIDPRRSRVVEFRYFGGLSVEETAEIMEISAVTVKRDWQAARAWLAAELGAIER
ncbi:MAG TPA: RNA polymerase subunit sigma-70 [Solibacterales bacterium]|nr:RNA polymerase subunit sigma-70 [Bryobacterales bacterium]